MSSFTTRSGVVASVTGSGPPVVLLAGYGQTSAVWDGLLPRLAGSFTCVTIDNRGVGAAAEQRPVTVEAMADDLAEVVDRLTGPVGVLGWSMGGIIAQAYALRRPERLAALALISTTARRSAAQARWTRLRADLQAAGSERELVEAALLPWLFTARSLAQPRRLEGILAANVRSPEPPLEGLRAQAEALAHLDHTVRLGDIDAPTLVVVGAEDLVTPVSDAAQLARGLPDAELVVLPFGGHAAVLEFPAEVLSPIIRFLRDRLVAPATAPTA
jgi:3-oxoadipate enol-lactonase